MRRTNKALVWCAVASLLTAFLTKSFFTVFFWGVLVCGVIAVLRWRRGLLVRGFAMAALVSTAVAFGIALAGFYSHNTEDVGEFDAGLTWVSDKTPRVAVTDSLLAPDVFTAALFGLDCNGVYGPNCSNGPSVAADALDGALLIGGVVVGNVFVRRQTSKAEVDRAAK